MYQHDVFLDCNLVRAYFAHDVVLMHFVLMMLNDYYYCTWNLILAFDHSFCQCIVSNSIVVLHNVVYVLRTMRPLGLDDNFQLANDLNDLLDSFDNYNYVVIRSIDDFYSFPRIWRKKFENWNFLIEWIWFCLLFSVRILIISDFLLEWTAWRFKWWIRYYFLNAWKKNFFN